MANKNGHRRFGTVRSLPSGRWQASYIGPDGQRRYAPNTFPSKTDAEIWLSTVEADLLRGEWTDPLLGKVKLTQFGEEWIKTRKIRKTTFELYEMLFRLHIDPFIGHKELRQISPEIVRSWRTKLLENNRSEITTAKAYRLLRAIMHTADDDGRIKRNPCRIKGADQEPESDRPVATVPQVYALADQMPPRFRALILAAGLSGLRWGELIALRRRDLDLDARTVRVARRLAQLSSGQVLAGPTKSTAGYRTIALPALLIPALREHMKNYVGKGGDALMFVGAKGAILKRGNWRNTVKWSESIKKAGLPEGFHFHDLRHTGNHLAASAGASTRELMHRMGHGSMRAAIRYQHATSERDREIADKVNRRAVAANKKASKKPKKQAKKKRSGDADQGSAGERASAA